MIEQTEPDLDRPANGAASEEALGVLHAAVANTLTDVIANGQVVTDKEGEAMRISPNPAYVGAAIAFLKNNNITASPSKNKDLAALRDTLASKRKRGDLKKPALEEAAAAFDAMQGHNGMFQ